MQIQTSVEPRTMNYARIIKYLYPQLEDRKDFAVRDDGNGPYIAMWKPTDIECPKLDFLASKELEYQQHCQTTAQDCAAQKDNWTKFLETNGLTVEGLKQLLNG